MSGDQWVSIAVVAADLSRRFAHIEQARTVKRTKGAWRRPQLAKLTSDLEARLKGAYDACEHGIALLVADQTQATDAERDALDHHGIDRDPDDPASNTVLAAVLLLLGAFRAQHLLLGNEAIAAAFALGRGQILKRLAQEGAVSQAATAVLLAQVTRQFEDDAQRLYTDLLDGSKRSAGVQTILADGGTVGATLLALRQLFLGEAFRLTLFAEHAVWWSWMAGFRAGAVDGTLAALAAGEEPLAFEWAGPMDAKCCLPCKGRFGGAIVARSLADLPPPSSICDYGVNCRHYYRVVG